MSSLRTRKLKKGSIKAMGGPFEGSLVYLQLQRIGRVLNQLQRNHLQRSQDLIKHVKSDLQMMGAFSGLKDTLKTLVGNTEALLLIQRKDFQSALISLNIDKNSKKHEQHPLVVAALQLTQALIFNLTERKEKAEEKVMSCLSVFSSNKVKGFINSAYNYKLTQVIVSSFYQTVLHFGRSEQQKDQQSQGLIKLCKEGYIIANRVLSQGHRLAILLRNIAGMHQSHENKSTKKKSERHFNFDSLTKKQKQLKRIYASEERPMLEAREQQKKDIAFYLKSLEKLTHMYGGSKQNRTTMSQNYRKRKKEKGGFSQAAKTNTESYHEGKSHHERIQDILLNNRYTLREGSRKVLTQPTQTMQKTENMLIQEEKCEEPLPPIFNQTTTQPQRQELINKAVNSEEGCQLI